MNMTLVGNEIIPIYQDDKDDLLVDARNLHAFLEVETKFADWVKRRVEEAGLTENQDYVRVSQKRETPTGFTTSHEYALLLDSAKHLAMMERNAKGKEVRQYFINFEKKARSRDLQKEQVIQAFIQELGKYAKLFSRSYYEALYSLLGWENNLDRPNLHPGYIGKLTQKLIYTKLAPGVYEELNKLNPYSSIKKRRKYVMSRLLTDDIGKEACRKQIDFVTEMAGLVDSIDQLIRIVEKRYEKKFGNSQQLSFLKVKYELIDV